MASEFISSVSLDTVDLQKLYNNIPHIATPSDLEATTLTGGYIYLLSNTTGNGFYYGYADNQTFVTSGSNVVVSQYTDSNNIVHKVLWAQQPNMVLNSLIMSDATVSDIATINTADITTANVSSQNTSAGTASIGTADITTASVSGNETVGGTLGVTGITTESTADITTASVSGNETVGGTLDINTASDGSLSGTTAGTITYYTPEQGTFKKFVAVFSGYENDTTTAQTITYPFAFTNVPIIENDTGLTLATTATILTITAPDATTTYSGMVIISGV